MTELGFDRILPDALLEEELRPDETRRALEVNIISVLTQLARGKWLIGKMTGIFAMSGVVLSLVVPARYTATTRIMTPQQTQSSASLLMNQLMNSGPGALMSTTGSGYGLKNPNDIYIGMLTSRPIADKIIQRFGLAVVYHSKDMTNARKTLATETQVTSEKSGFLAISITDKNKKLAADMANAYPEELSLLTNTLAVTEASQRRLFYEEQLKHAKEDLIAAELSFQKVQRQKGFVELDAQTKALVLNAATLNAQAAAKQVELQALRSYSTEQNPSVQLAEKQLSALQSEVSHLEQNVHPAGSADLGLQDAASAGIDYLRADHELRYRQALLDMLMKQYDAARLDEAKDAAVIQVVEQAIQPDQKSTPHRLSIVILFTLVGFIGTSLYLLALDFVRRNSELSDSLAEFRSVLVRR